MSSKLHRRKAKGHRVRHLGTQPGAAPGTLTPDPEAPSSGVRALVYSETQCRLLEPVDLQQLPELRKDWPGIWLMVEGLGDLEVITRIGEQFGIHRLILEDILNVHHRSKVESHDEFLFIIARMPYVSDRLHTDQISILLGRNFVISFEESDHHQFDPVRQRLQEGIGTVWQSHSDYLAYALLDAVIDRYYPVLEAQAERLDLLEDEILLKPGPDVAQRIQQAKRALIKLRRAIWPMREALNHLLRDPCPFIRQGTVFYLRDCYDHAVQIIDLVESYREMGADLTDLYLSSLSTRLNEVMKVLTMIATIFIPLSFFASLYGMNFDPDASPLNMPELRWRFGYPFALSLMAGTALVLMFLFWRKGWLARSGQRESSATEAASSLPERIDRH